MEKTSGRSTDIFLRIQAAYPTLTKAEKKVANCVTKDPVKASYMSIGELADECHVSLTTVFRFCRELKLEGYQEFRVMLALGLNQNEENEERELLPAEVKKTDTLDIVANKLLQSHTDALNETRSIINFEEIRKAAEYIDQSDQVRFFGIGASSLTAKEGMYKFLHIMPNVYCLSDVHMQAMSASTMNKDDVAVFVSRSGSNKEMVQMAKKVRELGAKVICITRYPRCPIVEYADTVLQHGGKEPPLQDGNISLKTAQNYVLDLLFTEVYRKRFHYSKEINERVTSAVVDKIL